MPRNRARAWRDVNGSGVILADDFAEVKRRFFTRLPEGQPATAAPVRRKAIGATADLRTP